jgi:hypothetical protein
MVVPDKVTYLTPSVSDVLAVATAEGRAPASETTATPQDATSGWEAVKPYVGGTP